MPRSKQNRPVAANDAAILRNSWPAPRDLLVLVLILAATWAAYIPAMSGGVQWDDDAHLTRPELQSATGLFRIWFDLAATQQYYPLLHSAFWFEHALWGDHLIGYHLANLLWHSVAVVLLYLILKKLQIPGALLAAAIFAIHPVMVESVAWISEQKNTLSAVFYLGSMLVYLRFDETRSHSKYIGALVLFVLALLTKTVTASLPAAVLVILWWKHGSLSWQHDVRPLVPFFSLGLVAGILTAWLERFVGGAQGSEFSLSFAARGLLAGRVIWFYLWQLLWPADLMFFYPRWSIEIGQWQQWLYPLAAVAFTILLWSIRRRTRAPLAAWLFFGGTLFPALGFINVYPFRYSYVADHFQYLASLGVIVFVSASVAEGISRLPHSLRPIVAMFCVGALATLGGLTWRQASTYTDSVTLNRATIERNPNSWIAQTNLGLALSDRGELAEALTHLQIARDLAPNAIEVRTSRASVLIKSDRWLEAVEEARAAIAVNPKFARAHNNLGVALLRLERTPEAIEALRQAVELKPDYSTARANLAMALVRSGQVQAAMEEYTQSLLDNPAQPDTLNGFGLLLATNDRPQDAARLFSIAVSLQPSRAEFHNNLASALQDSGSPEQAIAHYQEAVRLEPKYLPACFNLAKAFAAVGRTQDAVIVGRRASELAGSTGDVAAKGEIDAWLQGLHR